MAFIMAFTKITNDECDVFKFPNNYTKKKYFKMREKVIIALDPLVSHMSQVMSDNTKGYLPYDELRTAGIYGLISCFDTYDPSKNTKITTWAIRVIKSRMGNVCRKYMMAKRRYKEIIDLNYRVVSKDGKTTEMIDLFSDKHNYMEDIYNRDLLEIIKKKIKKKDDIKLLEVLLKYSDYNSMCIDMDLKYKVLLQRKQVLIKKIKMKLNKGDLTKIKE